MFKTKKIKSRSVHMHPYALMIMFAMYQYTIDNNLPFTVTDTVSTLEEDIELRRRSGSHRTGRAFDISMRGWDKLAIKDFVNYFNRRYKEYAAFSASSNKPALIILHDSGFGFHAHVQIHSKYSINTELTD